MSDLTWYDAAWHLITAPLVAFVLLFMIGAAVWEWYTESHRGAVSSWIKAHIGNRL